MKRNFNIHDLRIFYAVVMTGSTRQAAQSMHLTQPAVSHAIPPGRRDRRAAV
jgi:DNA-binding transcriptional LysR family regulator